MYILVNSSREGQILINTLNSKLFKFLIQTCQWGNFRNESSLFSYFKYPNIGCINNDIVIDDNFIYRYYKLNYDEINLFDKDRKNIEKHKINCDIDNIIAILRNKIKLSKINHNIIKNHFDSMICMYNKMKPIDI